MNNAPRGCYAVAQHLSSARRRKDFHVVGIICCEAISVIIPNQVKCLLFRNVSFVMPEGEETRPLKYFENS